MQIALPVVDVERRLILVWVALIFVGGVAWFGSGTPVVGACIVVAVLLATLSPAGAMLATCAGIPLIFHPIEVGSLHLSMLELGVVITTAGLVCRSVYDLVEDRSRLTFEWMRPAAIWVLPGLLLIVGTLSLVWIPFQSHFAEALRTWRWVIVEPLLLFAIARWTIARHGVVPVVLAIAAPAVIVAIAGIWQLASVTSTFAVDDVHRSTSTYLHPNNLALYLERTFFLIAVPGLLLAGRKWRGLLVLAAFILAGVAVTFSRGALLALFAGCATALLLRPLEKGWRYLLTASAVAGVAFWVVAGARFSGDESSGFVSTRRYLWSDSLEMLRDFPFTGIGLDQFLWLHRGRYIDPRIWNERYTSHPHNLLLDAWLSLGVAGVVFLGLMVVCGLWTLVQCRRGRIAFDPWRLGVMAALGAGLAHGLVDNGYFLPDLAAMTWLMIAIVVPYARATTTDPAGRLP
ncbi:MAG: O-antigen ligase family protein [Thermomicrobiales bacterium]|nr:O-antigen ligase family protein [Thermomicrobiales bacterium]